MRAETSQKQLAEAQATVRALQEELAETNRGLVALTMELEQRVEERTADLSAAHAELKKTNSKLMQMTLELEDRVTQRTAALQREVTERKRAVEEVHKLNAELEQRVIERTAALEAANKELETFSYSVSHDLRAPLRSIDGFSRILLEDYRDKLDDEGKDNLTRVRAASQRMALLIDDLLKLSHAGRTEMRRTALDLTALAGEIAAELQRAEPARPVRWVIAPNLAATGDTQLLRVNLENLLGNAWKFTSKRTDAVIEFGATDDDRGRAFFVRDNGAGFDMTYAPKLFGAFQRLHTSADFPGTGIGLATVQRIIHRHGGRVWAEGEVNHGATFYFTLPEPSQPT
jgi:light-regulated signal transduction histidine kinase (bacteriophytochrome)